MTEKKKKKQPVWKRIVKWFVGIFLVLFLLLLASPYLFKDKIKSLVLSSINKSLNATVNVDDVNLSFIRSFPLADVSLEQLDVINKAPFEGDTLFHAEELHLKMKITELFKGKDEPMNVQSFSVNSGQVNVLFNEEGKANYDIAIKKETENTSQPSTNSLSLDIQEYSLNDLDFMYFDAQSNIKLWVNDIVHSGSGNFKESVLDLDTQTQAKASFEMDSVEYVSDVNVTVDALIGIDLNNDKYTFKENKAMINQLPLEFEGFIQLVGENADQLYEISFHTPTSTFKNLLGVIPEQYSGNLQNVKTEGNFDLNGTVNGIYAENSIPKFDIQLNSTNAMFQYPNLPKSVQNINLDSRIINTTGDANDTYIQVNSLAFRIDQDNFNASGRIENLSKNPKVQLKAKGVMNLANISQAYPIQLKQELKGILRADVSSSFDMNSVEQGKYQNIQNAGNLSLSNFVYQGNDVANPFSVENASIAFTNNNIRLQDFKAKTENSDVAIKGALNNFYGFLFNKEVLKGNFTLTSNQIIVDDFMVENTNASSPQKSQSVVKIPAFLDCSFQASAKKVVYDGIDFSNASGSLKVKDESIVLENLQLNAFAGLIKMDGKVSTRSSVANFDMNLNLENLDIKQSFSQLSTLNSIAPIANIVGGKINSNLKMNGNLNESMTPNISTISGNLLGQLLNTRLNASNSKVLSLLGDRIPFIDVSKLNLEKIKTYIKFDQGNVIVTPFELNYKDIGIKVGGTHGFDQTMNYDITFDVPAKYLGNEVTSLLAKLSAKDQQEITSVPVKALLTGSFSQPKIQTNIKEATANLVKDLIQRQKDNLVDKGKDKLLNLLKKDKDSTKSNKNGLLNLIKKKKDS